jgi:hypothetical protein
MAIITRIITKTRFETGDVTTQSEFADLLDSVFMFGDDTLDNINQGVAKRYVTPSQISSWDSKAAGSHVHAIADVTGLQTTLNSKQSELIPSYLNGTDLALLGNAVDFFDLPSFFADIDGADIQIFASFAGTVSHDRFTAAIRNTSGVPQNVTPMFKYINTGDPASHATVAAGAVINVGVNEMLIIDGGFIVNELSQTVFVGYLDSKGI